MTPQQQYCIPTLDLHEIRSPLPPPFSSISPAAVATPQFPRFFGPPLCSREVSDLVKPRPWALSCSVFPPHKILFFLTDSCRYFVVPGVWRLLLTSPAWPLDWAQDAPSVSPGVSPEHPTFSMSSGNPWPLQPPPSSPHAHLWSFHHKSCQLQISSSRFPLHKAPLKPCFRLVRMTLPKCKCNRVTLYLKYTIVLRIKPKSLNKTNKSPAWSASYSHLFPHPPFPTVLASLPFTLSNLLHSGTATITSLASNHLYDLLHPISLLSSRSSFVLKLL